MIAQKGKDKSSVKKTQAIPRPQAPHLGRIKTGSPKLDG